MFREFDAEIAVVQIGFAILGLLDKLRVEVAVERVQVGRSLKGWKMKGEEVRYLNGNENTALRGKKKAYSR